jgi:hypothetical protein
MPIHDQPTPEACGASCYADAAAARAALALARPMIAAALADPQICGAGSCCAVVLDPAQDARSGARFDDAVLAEEDFGTRARWDADYAAFARAKARTAWAHGEGGLPLLALRAHRLREGDSLLRGAVDLDGIVVAFSGCFPPYDEAFATAIAANLRAIAAARLEAARARDALVAGA